MGEGDMRSRVAAGASLHTGRSGRS